MERTAWDLWRERVAKGDKHPRLLQEALSYSIAAAEAAGRGVVIMPLEAARIAAAGLKFPRGRPPPSLDLTRAPELIKLDMKGRVARGEASTLTEAEGQIVAELDEAAQERGESFSEDRLDQLRYPRQRRRRNK